MTELEEIKSMLEQLINRPPPDPFVPFEKEIWNAKQCADYLGINVRTFAEKLSLRPGFPRSFRLPSDKGLGSKRWWAREIILFAEGL